MCVGKSIRIQRVKNKKDNASCSINMPEKIYPNEKGYFYHFPMWYPGSGVVLDCINS